MTPPLARTLDCPPFDDALAAGVRAVRTCFDVGNYGEALTLCEGLLARYPASAEALLLLGLISYELDEPQRALTVLALAHERASGVREYADALACVNAQLGNDAEALYYAKLSTALAPHPLGEALLPERYSQFFESLRNANPHLFRRKAQRQFDAGNLRRALTLCEKQLELTPADTDTWRLLARAAGALGNLERVLDACDALGEDGLNAEDFDVLAQTLAEVGRFDEAEQAHRNAIDSAPDDPALAQSRIRSIAARYGSAGGHLARANADWVARFAPAAKAPQRQPARAADRALRVAYIGGELHTGPMVDLLTPIIAAHDTERVLPFCYATNQRYDTTSETLAAQCVRWTDVHGIDPLTLGEILRGDGIDIAVDLSGHGVGSQLQMLATHPTPVCVSWTITSHPAGAGFDYVLACEALVPQHADAGEVARAVHRLPSAHLAHRPPDAPQLVSPLPALSQGHLTLGVMAPLAQLDAAFFSDCAAILAEVPGARVIVANLEHLEGPTVIRIYELATAAGIRDRVDVAEIDGADAAGYGFCNHFDLLLDPQPTSRFLETCRALWMGVPVLALAGDGYLGGQAAAALHAAEKPHWVFADNAARAAAIAELAADRDALAAQRARLRGQVEATPLCDVKRFTRRLEDAFHAM